jgi:hypothetical protein
MNSMWKKAAKSNGNGGNNCVEVACVPATKSGAAGHCVEVGFAKAEESASVANCVEVSTALLPGVCKCDSIVVNGSVITAAKHGDVLVRDSKDKGAGPIIVFKPKQWEELISDVRRLGMNWVLRSERDGAPVYAISDPNNADVELLYTESEWDAFVDGVRKGEFSKSVAA